LLCSPSAEVWPCPLNFANWSSLHPAASQPSLVVGPASAQCHLGRYQVGAAGHPPPRAVPESNSGYDPELAPRMRVALGPLSQAPLPYKAHCFCVMPPFTQTLDPPELVTAAAQP
jgi:hypothetical protein